MAKVAQDVARGTRDVAGNLAARHRRRERHVHLQVSKSDKEQQKSGLGVGQRGTTVSTGASRPSCPGFNSEQSQIFSEEFFFDFMEVNQSTALLRGKWTEA